MATTLFRQGNRLVSKHPDVREPITWVVASKTPYGYRWFSQLRMKESRRLDFKTEEEALAAGAHAIGAVIAKTEKV